MIDEAAVKRRLEQLQESCSAKRHKIQAYLLKCFTFEMHVRQWHS